MFKRTKLSTAALLACGGALLSSGAVAVAQESQSLDRVTVTGSNVRRVDAETPSPVQVITAEQIKQSGYTRITEVLQAITANGQGTLSQGFSGAFATGGSGVALRGLTVGATLVLIDGRRMAPYPIGDDGQRSFVDISSIPFDAVERIEVLKDGASAVYGSDAIAGVVNVILKRSFVGKSITIDGGVSSKRDGETGHVAGTFGFGDLDKDGRNFFVSGEYRKQNQIKYRDRGGLLTQTDFTSTGGIDTTLGVPNSANSGLARSGTGYITDDAGDILGFLPGCDSTRYAAGQCTFSDTWQQVQPPTENFNLLGRFTQRLGSDWQASFSASFFESKAQQIDAPNNTFTAGRQGITSGPGVIPALRPVTPRTTIPNTHPQWPAGIDPAITSGVLRYTFLDVGPGITDSDAKSTRFVADIDGSVAGWDISAAAGITKVKLDVTTRNAVQAERLQTALNSATNPYIIGGPNDPAVVDFIAPELRATQVSKLNFLHVGAGRELMKLDGGPLALALGADYIYRTQDARAPADVAAGLTTGQSNNYTVGKQTVSSVYAELVAPLTKTFEAEGAVRYDRYNISGGKASPKLGFKWTPNAVFALRGTAGRGFRAPSPAENGDAGQTFFAGTSDDPALCPDGDVNTPGNFPSQCGVRFPTVQGSTKTLKPEISKTFTLGVILEPTNNFSASVDFYSIEVKDQIVAGSTSTLIRGTNLTPLPRVQPDGTSADEVPPVPPIAYFSAGYENAGKVETQGVDVNLIFKENIPGVGSLKSDFMVSYITKYNLTDASGTTYKLAGTHGTYIISGATGTPKTRASWSNTLETGPLSLTGTVSYISSFDLTDPSFGINNCLDGVFNGAGSTAYDDLLNAGVVPPGVSCKVGSFTTFDLYARYKVSKGLTISASVLNLFDRGFPADWLTYGGGTAPYNPSFHLAGAVGRYFTIGAKFDF